MTRKNSKYDKPLTAEEKKKLKTILTKELRDKLTPEEKEKLERDFLKIMGPPVRMVIPLTECKRRRK